MDRLWRPMGGAAGKEGEGGMLSAKKSEAAEGARHGARDILSTHETKTILLLPGLQCAAHALPPFFHLILFLPFDVGQIDGRLDIVLAQQVEARPLTDAEQRPGGLCTQPAAYVGEQQAAFAEGPFHVDRGRCAVSG